ncbi:MAG: type I methionyl aminopeptidase [Bdellovibrionales bacterium]|nr:type I methionyl aminopeptidase [Bdellovibrionales bacterium]
MGKIIIKNEKQIEGIRKASRLTAQILDAVTEIIQPGMSTEDIDAFVVKLIHDAGAIAATLNYNGYPKSCCTSVNEVVCHGIPSPNVRLKQGDIVNVDVTSVVDGFFGDSNRMYFVGDKAQFDQRVIDLVEHTKQCLQVGMDEVAPDKHFGDIGAAIKQYVESLGTNYGIVKEYTGHGVGIRFHEEPQVVHVGRFGSGPTMKPGMVFTIEPMINLGTAKTVLSSLDGWTVRTADNQYSAQWEHTLLVTDSGYEILTVSE